MKKRTKEENASYSRLLREKKRSTSVSPTPVAPIKNVAPVSPCQECKKLQARIVLLEAENRVRARAYPSKVKDDPEDLFKRVMRAKENRLYGH